MSYCIMALDWLKPRFSRTQLRRITEVNDSQLIAWRRADRLSGTVTSGEGPHAVYSGADCLRAAILATLSMAGVPLKLVEQLLPIAVDHVATHPDGGRCIANIFPRQSGPWDVF